MNRADIVIGVVFALAFLYPLAMRVLAVRMQPTRSKMQKLGEELLASPALNDRQKALVESMLDDSFSPRFMIFVSLAMPFYVIARLTVWRKPRSPFAELSPSVAERVKKLQNYHLRAVAAANPICTVLVVFELVIFWLPLRLVGFINGDDSNSHGNMRADARSLAAEIESRRSHTFSGRIAA